MRAENRLASAFEEFILPYDALRTAAPDAALLELHKGESDFAAPYKILTLKLFMASHSSSSMMANSVLV